VTQSSHIYISTKTPVSLDASFTSQHNSSFTSALDNLIYLMKFLTEVCEWQTYKLHHRSKRRHWKFMIVRFIGRLSVTEDYDGEQCQFTAKGHSWAVW